MTVTAADDDDGLDDSVTLTHTAAGGEYAGVSADLLVTITDDDTAGLVITPSSLTVGEGDTAGVSYTVALATQPTEEVTVTVSGHSGTDVSPDETTLTFTPGNWNMAQAVTVTARQDDDGADDYVTLTHTASGGEYAGVEATLSVTVDDDYKAPTGVTLVVTPGSVREESGETEITVTATLTGGDPRAVDTEIALSVEGVSILPEDEDGFPTNPAVSTPAVSDGVDRGPIRPADFTTEDGATLIIPAGQPTGTASIAFTPTNDTMAEGDETAQVSGTSEGLEVTPGVLVIVDDDPNPTGIHLSASPSVIHEGDGRLDLEITATVVGGGTFPEEVRVVLFVNDESATYPEDVNGTFDSFVHIEAGERSGSNDFLAVVGDDEVHEPTEEYSYIPEAARWGRPGDHPDQTPVWFFLTEITLNKLVITIIDNDTTGLLLSRSSLSVDEGDSAGVSYTVALATQPRRMST